MLYQGLDNRIYRRLPEGVSIQVTPAGLAVRVSAYLYDLLFRSAVFLCFSLVFSQLGKVGEGLLLVVFFVISWGYYIFFECRDGRTPGKKKFKLRVVQDNSLPVTPSQVVLRNLIRPADSFPFLYILGVLVMSNNRLFKRLGDWAAGTIVVHEHVQPDSETKFSEQSEAPEFLLSTEDQQTIIAFAEHSQFLSEARQAELANILEKKLKATDQSAAEKLKRIAQYYVGQDV